MDAADTDVELLLEAIYERYGYDFRDYSKAHVTRRVLQRLRLSGLNDIATLRSQVLAEPLVAERLLRDLSINVTEMFRDPEFFKALREHVIPLLKTWSFIKVWHAGCSTGEEVYSMAILLKEEGLYDRVQIYATDFNEFTLAQAREGIFPVEVMKKFAQNYLRSGARGTFSDHYLAHDDSAIMDSSLKKNIVWANHNLVTDTDFTETQLIFCRNVLIYFNAELQGRVQSLFHRSLVNGGFLCLGKKETLNFSPFRSAFTELVKNQKIYRKRYEPT